MTKLKNPSQDDKETKAEKRKRRLDAALAREALQRAQDPARPPIGILQRQVEHGDPGAAPSLDQEPDEPDDARPLSEAVLAQLHDAELGQQRLRRQRTSVVQFLSIFGLAALSGAPVAAPTPPLVDQEDEGEDS